MQCDAPPWRRRAAGAGRGGRPHAALEDANLNLVRADDAHEFDVGLVREIRMHADLRANLSATRFPSTEKSALSTTMTKCGLPVETSTPTTCKPARQRHGAWREAGYAHAGGHFHGEFAVGFQRVHVANAQARFGGNFQLRRRVAKPRSRAIHAATQRVPLPLISAMEPSALCRRMRPARWHRSTRRTRCRRHRRQCSARTIAASIQPSRGSPRPLRSQSGSRCRRHALW